MSENTCIFCKIANGEIPSKTIYEDDDFRAFLDVNPASRGHVLIIPKKHYANLYELPDAVLTKILKLSQSIAKRMNEKLKCDGLNLVQNNGEAAGQTVFHFHLHLIPRYKSAVNKNILSWDTIEMTDKELVELEKELQL